MTNAYKRNPFLAENARRIFAHLDREMNGKGYLYFKAKHYTQELQLPSKRIGQLIAQAHREQKIPPRRTLEKYDVHDGHHITWLYKKS